MKTRTKLVGLLLITLFIAGCDKELTTKQAGNLVPKTVMEDASLPSITVNGTTLHAETFGNADSPMVVMLHGGPGGDYRAMLKLKELANDG
jgi:proline iminopeptidase